MVRLGHSLANGGRRLSLTQVMKRNRKSLRDFIAEHRAELDEAIARRLNKPHNPIPTDNERRLWVLNDEPLYRWAQSEGVAI